MSVPVHMENLTVRAGEQVILDHVTLTLEEGKLNAIIGPNGAGKTTLLHVLLGFVPHEGLLRLDGGRRPRIGFVPQQPAVDRSTPATVCEFLAAGLTRRPPWLGRGKTVRAQVESALEDVGIADRMRRRLGDLSGGEFQRMMLAQALLRKPDLLLLDEPNTGVDITGAQLFCGLVEKIHKARSLTTVLVTHDIGVVADHAHRVIGLNKKVLFEGPSPDTLTPENLMLLFGPHSNKLAVARDTHHSLHRGRPGPEGGK